VLSERSGAAGAQRRLELAGPKGLKAISWNERRDNPCWFEVVGRNLDNVGIDQEVEHDACGKAPRDGSEMLVGYLQTESMVFVSGLRVCMDGGGERVKGIQLRGRVLGLQGALTPAEGEPRQERTNCKDWRRWVECPAGSIASGLVAELEAGDEPRSASGLRLLCSKVAAQAEEVYAPRLTGPIAPLDEVSGKRGEGVDLLPGNGGRGLDLVHWAERRDRPCTVTVEGRDLAVRNARSDAKVNRCGKKDVEEKLNLASASMKFQTANAFITGLRVCTSNGRVKGVEVEGRIPVARDDPDPPKPVLEHDKGWQVNCALAQALGAANGEWVRCSPRQVAVGLQAHFDGGEEPRAVRGMTLLCRAYE
jgi:hypothetical protein